jgi:tetratricopeptide (TPR) repeat protein
MAVIGKDVEVAVLAAVTGLDDVETVRRLDRLAARGFLYESGGAPVPRFSFTHVLVLEVALRSLVRERRRELELSVLQALERLHAGGLAEHGERLAHHAIRAEAWERAVKHCRAAGARALARSAHGAAVQYFEHALAALGHLPQSSATVVAAIDLRLDLRAALIPLGEYRRTVAYLREAEVLARAASDEERLAAIGSHLGNYLHLTGHLDSAIEQSRDALAIAERLGNVDLIVVTTAYLAFTYHTAGDFPAAADLARRNVDLLQGPLRRKRFGMTSLPAVYSRTCLAWALAELGDFEAADAAGAEALAIAEQEDHAYSIVYACLGAGVPRLRRGDFEAACVLLESAADLCRSAEIPVLRSMIAVPLAAAYGYAGRVADAIRLLEETSARARDIRDPIGHWVRTGALAQAYALGGRALEAQPLALQYLQQRRSIGARGYEAWALHLLGEVTEQLGAAAQAQAHEHYGAALAAAQPLGMRPLAALCRLGLGRTAGRLGCEAEAAAAITAASEEFRAMGMTTWLTRAHEALPGGSRAVL